MRVDGPSPSILLIPIALCLSGCLVDRGGTRSPGRDAGLDAQAPILEAGADGGSDDGDSGSDAGRPARDAGECAPGWVDANGLSGDGCECELNSPTTELCNGRDDDCDPSTPDGADEPWFEGTCDGADADRCEDGVDTCVPNLDGFGASRTCTDLMVDTPELCSSSGDEDCDGRVDEEGAVDAMVFYRDADDDTYGDPTMSRPACSQPAGYVPDNTDCDDSAPALNPGMTETCNGRDDDCGGDIDEDNICGCPVRLRDGRPYLFCTAGQTWDGARRFCQSPGYRLVIIEDSTERGWISTAAREIADRPYWIGLHQDGSGAWVWVDSSAASGIPWHGGEPNNGGPLNDDEDCVEINRFRDDRYNDGVCGDSKAFVCEWPP